MQGTLGHVTAFLPKERKLIFVENFKTGLVMNSQPAPKTATQEKKRGQQEKIKKVNAVIQRIHSVSAGPMQEVTKTGHHDFYAKIRMIKTSGFN